MHSSHTFIRCWLSDESARSLVISMNKVQIFSKTVEKWALVPLTDKDAVTYIINAFPS